MKQIDKISDTVLGKITGRNISTILISLDEMIDMIDRNFVQQAETEEERRAIYMACTGKFFGLVTKDLDSKDGNYRIMLYRHQMRNILQIKNANYIYLYDKTADTFYKYRATLWGRMKKAIAAKCGIA